MKKTKYLYVSLALGVSCLALIGCRKKSKSDKIDYDKPYHFINFYDPGYVEENGSYYKNEYGNYLLDEDKTVIESRPVNVGSKITKLPTPKKQGYTFVGWYIDPGLAAEFYHTEMPDGNLVAYARWQKEQDVIYVAPDNEASPFNSGTKASDPMTLMEAARVYRPGATIRLAEGTYDLNASIVFGNNGDYKHVTNIEGNNAILDFKQMQQNDSNVGIKFAADYTNISNVTVKGAGDNGLLLGSSNCVIKDCVFTENKDTGLQISRYNGSIQQYIDTWPSNNLILNCTSYNNCDTAGEDADGFAAKLTVGQGNIFDGCLAYWNVDDGWDLYAKQDSGRIGTVTIRNSVSLQNGKCLNKEKTGIYEDFSGDGNGFKLGGSSVKGEVIVENCIAAYNYAHGFTDNSNPGVISIKNCTSINNGQYGDKAYDNFNLNRDGVVNARNYYEGLYSFYNSKSKNTYNVKTDEFNGSVANSVFYISDTPYIANGSVSAQADSATNNKSYTGSKIVSKYTPGSADVDYTSPDELISKLGTTNFHSKLRNEDGSLNLKNYWKAANSVLTAGMGANLTKSSMDDYNHTELKEINASATEDEEKARTVYNALNLAVNSKYIYNDIYLPTLIGDTEITWISSNPDVIKISEDETKVENELNYKYGILADRIDQDTEVTLTATIKISKKVSLTKDFKVTVQALDPRAGEITGIDDVTLLNNETLPDLHSYNVYDYVSTRLILTENQDYTASYTVKYTNEFVADKSLITTPVSGLDASKTGTYLVTYTFKIDGYEDVVKTRLITLVGKDDTYEVINASTQLGYIIDDVVSVTGYANYKAGTAYAVALSAQNDAITADEIINGSAANVVSASNVQLTDRTFKLDLALNDSYVSETSVYVYIVIKNANGNGKIYKMGEVKPTEIITTAAELEDAITNKANNAKAYKLGADIDMDGATWNQDSNSSIFKGYFDGDGHTISNLNISVTGEGGGLFYKVTNQATIKNLKLEEVFTTQADIATENGGKTAVLVGEIKAGATIENIWIHNCGVNAYQRVAAVVGQLSGDDANASTTIIRNVLVTSNKTGNTKYTYSAAYTKKDAQGNDSITGGKYVGGIMAHLQLNATGHDTTLEISNCVVSATLRVFNQFGAGILGRVDPRQRGASISIKNCAFDGTITSTSSYVAGILAGRNSGDPILIENCVTSGNVAASSGIGMTVSQQVCNKKTIGTDKFYEINPDYVTMVNCYYALNDYNPETDTDYANADEYYAAKTLNKEYYGIAAYTSELATAAWWKNTVKFDLDNIWDFNESATSNMFSLKYFSKN